MTNAVNIASLGSPMSADSSGNVGVGATPPTSDLGKSITINTAGNSLWSSQANQTDLLANATYNGGWKFVSGSSNYANRISVGNANGQYAWQTSSAAGTSGNAITFNQLMTLNTNGVLGLYGGSTTATGVGIAFPATQSASNDANTLDDYEEGTFTPKAGNGSTAMATIYKATYTKIGNRVLIDLDVVFPNPNPADNTYLTNLPFAGSSSAGNGGVGMGYYNGPTSTGLYAHVSSSTTNLAFYTYSGTGVNMSAARIICSLEYQTS